MGKYYNKQSTALAVAARDMTTLYLLPKRWTVVPPELEGSAALMELVQKGLLVYRAIALPEVVQPTALPEVVQPIKVPVLPTISPILPSSPSIEVGVDHVVLPLEVHSEAKSDEESQETFPEHFEEAFGPEDTVAVDSVTTEKRSTTKSRRR